ncbi:MAG TPA: hypothetical protein VLS48_03195 [Anaerolineales bacterium]|nr:hypothetical protein [Anaerolineales bacterium]
MISMAVFFWMYVSLFAVVGALRGWAKELLVTFSVILALFLITVLESWVPVVRDTIVATGGTTLFWMRTVIMLALAFFGYQTPNIRAFQAGSAGRERLQDSLLGFILGGLNGYLLIGSIWFYMAAANYPFRMITTPQPGDTFFDATQSLLGILPPLHLAPPWIYFAVGLAFLFVIVVFI